MSALADRRCGRKQLELRVLKTCEAARVVFFVTCSCAVSPNAQSRV